MKASLADPEVIREGYAQASHVATALQVSSTHSCSGHAHVDSALCFFAVSYVPFYSCY